MTLVKKFHWMILCRGLDAEGWPLPGFSLSPCQWVQSWYLAERGARTVLFSSLITKHKFNLVQGFVLVRIETCKNVDKCHHESTHRTSNLHRHSFRKKKKVTGYFLLTSPHKLAMKTLSMVILYQAMVSSSLSFPDSSSHLI